MASILTGRGWLFDLYPIRRGMQVWFLREDGEPIALRERYAPSFYVRGRGWTAAKNLMPGDHLRSHDGQWMVVQDVRDSGEIARVYNLRISDYHTYFVGCEEWGFVVVVVMARMVAAGAGPGQWRPGVTVARHGRMPPRHRTGGQSS